MIAEDLDYIALQKASEETGIQKLLKASGKNYFALRPSWNKNRESKYKQKLITVYQFNIKPTERLIYLLHLDTTRLT